MADGVVRIGLIPGVCGGEAAAAGEVELAQAGGNGDGLGGGDLPAGLELFCLDAVHEAVAVSAGHTVPIPGVGGHVVEVVVIGGGLLEPHPAAVPAGFEGMAVLAEIGRAVGGQLPVLGEPAQEGGLALGGRRQVVLARAGYHLRSLGNLAPGGIEGQGELSGLDGEGLIGGVGGGPGGGVGVGGLEF